MQIRAQESFAQKIGETLVEADEVTVRRRPDGITVIERDNRHDLPVIEHGDHLEQADTAYRRGDEPEVIELGTIDVAGIDGVERI